MAGVVETTNTFVTNQVITSTVMNNIIDQTLFTSDALSGNTLALTAGKMKVATSGITSNEMGVGAVTANAIAANAVTTSAIAANAVTANAIAANAVTAAKILESNVTTGKIADAAISAPKLNGAQTGTAPIFGCRAWVSFDATRNAAGTNDALLTNRFIRASGNVSSVQKTAAGTFVITFTIAMPSANYQVSGSATGIAAHPVFSIAPTFGAAQTASQLQISTGTTGSLASGGVLDNSSNANISVFA